MTFEEMERGLKVLQDNLTVQGAMMYRLENNLDRLEGLVTQNSQSITALTEVAKSHEQRLQVCSQRWPRSSDAWTDSFAA